MVFSDSLFVATPSGRDCLLFCETLTRYCIENDVPLRTGIGYGMFVSHGFSFESTPRLKIVSTQFLGSAVIRAVEAEKVLKGARIALHPKAARALESEGAEEVKLIELSEDEGLKDGKRVATHEWNILSSFSEMGGIVDADFDDQENRLLKHLNAMRTASPTREHIHYSATIESLGRMVKLRNSVIRDPDERDRPWP